MNASAIEPFESEDELLDSVQLRKRLKIGNQTLNLWRRYHVIPFVQVSKKIIRYDWQDVRAALLDRFTVPAND